MIRKLPTPAFARWDHFATLSEMDRLRLGPQSRWHETGRMMHFVAEEKGRFVGRISAFINPRLQDQPLPTGLVGAAEFAPEALEGGAPELKNLLDVACAWLAENGMRTARGPMSFSGWYSHGAITYSTGYPPFLGENALGERYARVFAEVMQPVATYRTALVAGASRLPQPPEERGVRIRAIPAAEVAGILPMIHALISRVLAHEWSFAPIGLTEFRELFLPVSTSAPDFHLLIAETVGGDPIGLCFGHGSPGLVPGTAVIWTCGVVPEWESKTLGSLLTARFHADLKPRGYEDLLLAMLKEDGTPRHPTDAFATKVRGYSLFERAL